MGCIHLVSPTCLPLPLPPAGSKTPPWDEKHHPAGQCPPPVPQHQLQCQAQGVQGKDRPWVPCKPWCTFSEAPASPFLGGHPMLRFLPALRSLPSFWVVPASAPRKARWVALGCGISCSGSLVFPLPLPTTSVVPSCGPSCLLQSGGISIEGKRRKEARPDPSRGVVLDLAFHSVSSSLGPTSPP